MRLLKMRHLLTVVIFLVTCFSAVAQDGNNKNALTFRALLADYFNPNGGDLSDYKPYRYGYGFSYNRNLTSFLDVSVPFRFLNGRLKDQSTNTYVFGGDIQAQAKYYKPGNKVIPYILSGFGGDYIKDEGVNFQIPVGAGVDIRMFDRGYFNFNTEYRFSLKTNRNNFIHGIGFKYLLGKKNKLADMDSDGVVDSLDLCPDIKGLAAFNGCPDSDNDGVPDHLDECPDKPGSAKSKGCPDKDFDGIPDHLDKCPNQAGPIENQGCPVVDKDGDGIPDTEDLCPDVPGMKSAMGCPDMDEDGVPDDKDECPDMPGLKIFKGCPDTDGDGVEDRYDRCPDIPGSKANKGCPEIKKEDRQKLEFAMQAVQFELGKTTLLTSSYPILNDIADIMKRYPDYFLTISGHTDPSGKIETNRKLSTNRAKACYNYLVSKGISTGRMEYVGYGPDKPRFDNSTEEGRIKNRRVEFNLDLK